MIFCTSWPLGLWLLEYIYSLLSLGPFIFGMPGILSPILVLVRTLVLDLGASQPLTVLIDLGMVIFHTLLHLWRIFSLHSVFTPVVTLTRMVVYAWMLGLHLSSLFMSHRSPHYFIWVLLSWSFLPISYSLDSLLTILGCFALIWLSCRVQFLYTLSEVSTRSCLSQVSCLNWHIG